MAVLIAMISVSLGHRPLLYLFLVAKLAVVLENGHSSAHLGQTVALNVWTQCPPICGILDAVLRQEVNGTSFPLQHFSELPVLHQHINLTLSVLCELPFLLACWCWVAVSLTPHHPGCMAFCVTTSIWSASSWLPPDRWSDRQYNLRIFKSIVNIGTPGASWSAAIVCFLRCGGHEISSHVLDSFLPRVSEFGYPVSVKNTFSRNWTGLLN